MPNVTRKEDVEAFLKSFKEKKQIWGVYFLDSRGKNFNTLSKLEIRPVDREQVLEDLTVKDFSQGPLVEELHGGKDMWVFGTVMKKKEIYIKITLGAPSTQTICISFHTAEYPMAYPFKN